MPNDEILRIINISAQLVYVIIEGFCRQLQFSAKLFYN